MMDIAHTDGYREKEREQLVSAHLVQTLNALFPREARFAVFRRLPPQPLFAKVTLSSHHADWRNRSSLTLIHRSSVGMTLLADEGGSLMAHIEYEYDPEIRVSMAKSLGVDVGSSQALKLSSEVVGRILSVLPWPDIRVESTPMIEIDDGEEDGFVETFFLSGLSIAKILPAEEGADHA